MDSSLLIQELTQTIDWWITELKHYTLQQLKLKPTANSWSLGQVYSHVINETNFYFVEINRCLKNEEHHFDKKSEEVKGWFHNNSYPDKQFQGPPNAEEPAQPRTKEQLLSNLQKLKSDLNFIKIQILQNLVSGKTRHPGHGYFNAVEWLQFADMHLRHHARQKERIDRFITKI